MKRRIEVRWAIIGGRIIPDRGAAQTHGCPGSAGGRRGRQGPAQSGFEGDAAAIEDPRDSRGQHHAAPLGGGYLSLAARVERGHRTCDRVPRAHPVRGRGARDPPSFRGWHGGLRAQSGDAPRPYRVSRLWTGRGVHGLGDRGAPDRGGEQARLHHPRPLADPLRALPARELSLPDAQTGLAAISWGADQRRRAAGGRGWRTVSPLSDVSGAPAPRAAPGFEPAAVPASVAAESMSRACSRALAVIWTPPNMRANSSTRSSPLSSVRVVRVLRPSLCLVTRRCWCAWQATCGRCVTHSTWPRTPSERSSRPTISATAPPIPASTSSNTMQRGSCDAHATCTASDRRESSPPEATLARERGGEPGLAVTRNSI